MSDVEKAIAGTPVDKKQAQTAPKAKSHSSSSTTALQQHNSAIRQQRSSTANNETGNRLAFHQQDEGKPGQEQYEHQHQHQHQHQQQHQPHKSEAGDPLDAANHCISRLVKLIFSTPGLVVVVVLYSVMGALIFPLLEAPQDINKSQAIAKSREECLRELWAITEKLNVLYERNWTMLVHEQLRRFEGTIVAATRNGGGAADLGLVRRTSATTSPTDGDSAVARFGTINGAEASVQQASWSFSEALLYSVTVITTIGHGSLMPRTAAGKIATILYALIGVPLMLMCLSSLGTLLAEALQCTYARVCCRWALVDESPGRSRYTKPHRCHRNRRVLERGGAKACGCEFQGKSNAVDCNNCKYDAVIDETSAVNRYDYGHSSDTRLVDRGEDSCKLLQCSPVKPDHSHKPHYNSTAGGQPKMPIGTTAQYYQPHPDVMLLTTGQKLSTHHLYQPPQPSQPSQPSQSAQTSPLLAQCSAAPQHLQHVRSVRMVPSAASAESPPQHQTLLRHYVTATNPPQHYVAVPSSLVRFQATSSAAHTVTSTSLATAGASGPLATNCYPPAAAAAVLPVSGSATVYFPIAAPSTATAGLQPFLKYHTIQVQHRKPSAVASESASLGQQQHPPEAQLYDTLPPPPPAYQTASVHGVRRAKLLTRPLPQEINTLLAGTDASGRHDLLQNTFTIVPATAITAVAAPTATTSAAHSVMLSTGTIAAASATTTTSIINNYNAATFVNVCGNRESTTPSPLPPPPPPPIPPPSSAPAPAPPTPPATVGPVTRAETCATSGLASTATVDIMEDEEEHEQQRLGNCPHGTPSRVPLISSSPSSSSKSSTHQPFNSSEYCNNNYNRNGDKVAARNLLNVTAASFHRHTLSTFQSGAGPKSVLVTRRSGCTMHTPAQRRPSNGAVCFGDATAGSEDVEEEGDYSQCGAEQFVLKQVDRNGGVPNDNPNEDEEEDVDTSALPSASASASAHGVPQVPMTLVLLILACYVCLGTVIFALWENWSLVDGAYFCFVTLTTIGYGDFLPERTFRGPEVQLFACCAYLLLGLVLVAMSFSILESQLMWKCKRIAVRLKLATE